jgi:hypothetical protein
MPVLQVFVYLQLLDYITTMIGFSLGASEMSPFIVKLIQLTSPALGVAASKLVGLGIGGLCVATHRTRLIGWINYWYAGLIVWNLSTIFAALSYAKHTGALPVH